MSGCLQWCWRVEWAVHTFVLSVHLCHLYIYLISVVVFSSFYTFLKVLKQVWHLSGLPLHLSLSHKLAGFWLACGECHKRLYGVFTAPHSYLHLSTKRTITTHGHGVHASTVSAPFFFKLSIFLWLCLCPHFLWIANGPQGLLIWGGNLYDHADFAFTSLCLPSLGKSLLHVVVGSY